jgi:hypothetical protein
MTTYAPGDRVRCTMPVPRWNGQSGTIREAVYPPGVYLVAMDVPELNIGTHGVSVLHERFLEKIEPAP